MLNSCSSVQQTEQHYPSLDCMPNTVNISNIFVAAWRVNGRVIESNFAGQSEYFCQLCFPPTTILRSQITVVTSLLKWWLAQKKKNWGFFWGFFVFFFSMWNHSDMPRVNWTWKEFWMSISPWHKEEHSTWKTWSCLIRITCRFRLKMTAFVSEVLKLDTYCHF